MSALTAVLAMSAMSVTAGFVIAHRARSLARLSIRQQRRSREHELHWAAIRLRGNGYQGHDLQEILCLATNCTPSQADAAIFRVGADV